MHVRWSPIHQAGANGAVQKSSKVFSALACVLSIARVKFCLSVLSVRTNSGLCSTKTKNTVQNRCSKKQWIELFLVYLDPIYARKTFVSMIIVTIRHAFLGLYKISNQLSIFWAKYFTNEYHHVMNWSNVYFGWFSILFSFILYYLAWQSFLTHGAVQSFLVIPKKCL